MNQKGRLEVSITVVAIPDWSLVNILPFCLVIGQCVILGLPFDLGLFTVVSSVLKPTSSIE